MKIVLHIGGEKTGSTSIQSCLHGLRPELINRKVYYCSVDNLENHVFLVDYVNAISSQHDCRERIKKDLSLDFEKANNHGCDLYLISSELICANINTLDKIYDLFSLLYELSDSIEVVCYLRPQIDLHASRIQAMIKSGAYVNPDEFFNDLVPSNYYYNYAEQYKLWALVAGQDSLKFRPFLNTNVLDDFLNIIGLNDINIQQAPKRNVSVDLHLLALLNSFNYNNSSVAFNHVNIFDDFKIHNKLKLSLKQVKLYQNLFEEVNSEFLLLNKNFPEQALSSVQFLENELDNIKELDGLISFGGVFYDFISIYNFKYFYYKFKASFSDFQIALISNNKLEIRNSYLLCEHVFGEVLSSGVNQGDLKFLLDEYTKFKQIAGNNFLE